VSGTESGFFLTDQVVARLVALALLFTQAIYRRFLILLAAASLTTGRRTIIDLLGTLATLAPCHVTVTVRPNHPWRVW
jgi:hypothetical protein